MENLRIGTCSWKYPSWKGLVYSSTKPANFLEEYAKKYDSVEIDQWFWSLFAEEKITLPAPETATEYFNSVSEDFKFTIKAPNSVTLTHFYTRLTGGKLVQNPHFLSVSLFRQFLDLLGPLRNRLGLVMLQFEYLNKKKMSGLSEFLAKLDAFLTDLDTDVPLALEPRNPQFFSNAYFDFLKRKGLSHVFMQGYFMPEISSLYRRYGNLVGSPAVIRLHGYEREEIEKKTNRIYNTIVEPKDDELPGIIEMIQDMRSRGIEVYLNVNNHYEGSAPLTIEKILGLLG